MKRGLSGFFDVVIAAIFFVALIPFIIIAKLRYSEHGATPKFAGTTPADAAEEIYGDRSKVDRLLN